MKERFMKFKSGNLDFYFCFVLWFGWGYGGEAEEMDFSFEDEEKKLMSNRFIFAGDLMNFQGG